MPLARSTHVRHQSGVAVKTPLLVPAFSSKGSRFTSSGKSEISDAVRASAEFLTDTVSVSAYDIYHKHIPHPARFSVQAELTFVDSGGYETADEHDLSAVFRHTCPVKRWTERLLVRVLDTWPDRLPAVFVSFDHGSVRKSLSEQIIGARKLFSKYPGHLHEIIVKPERATERTLAKTLPKLLRNAQDLRGFDLIGVTEKELGGSVLDRMENVAKLRLALDEAGVGSPIHVFGALAPVMSCLYFIAGAEVFDGLTWLRYSFLEGQCVYVHEYGAVRVGIQERDELVIARNLADNINYLQKLTLQMQAYLLERDFGKFEHNGQYLARAYDTLRGRIGRGV